MTYNHNNNTMPVCPKWPVLSDCTLIKEWSFKAFVWGTHTSARWLHRCGLCVSLHCNFITVTLWLSTDFLLYLEEHYTHSFTIGTGTIWWRAAGAECSWEPEWNLLVWRSSGTAGTAVVMLMLINALPQIESQNTHTLIQLKNQHSCLYSQTHTHTLWKITDQQLRRWCFTKTTVLLLSASHLMVGVVLTFTWPAVCSLRTHTHECVKTHTCVQSPGAEPEHTPNRPSRPPTSAALGTLDFEVTSWPWVLFLSFFLS